MRGEEEMRKGPNEPEGRMVRLLQVEASLGKDSVERESSTRRRGERNIT